MTTTPTLAQIAADYALWEEYVDRQGLMSERQFDALDVDERLRMISEDMGFRDDEEAQP